MQDVVLIYLSLGSNLGNRRQNLDKATGFIATEIGNIESVSRIYESTARGFLSDHLFLNSCLSANTKLTPAEVIAQILFIESSMGRVRSGGDYADRIIDIDLLFYGNQVIHQSELMVPHPRLGERMFVLLPLREIAPGMVHPVTGITISEMLEKCEDPETISPV